MHMRPVLRPDPPQGGASETDSYGGSFGEPTRLLQGRLLRLAFQVKW